MAFQDRDVRSAQTNRTDARFNQDTDNDEIPLGDLLRRFGQDAAALVRQEIALAKLELRETARGYAADAGRLGAAAVVGWFGAMTFIAFLVIGLGSLIHNYWLSALIVAVVLLAMAAILARKALAHMKQNSLAPKETVQTIQEDQRWASHEVKDFKRKLKA